MNNNDNNQFPPPEPKKTLRQINTTKKNSNLGVAEIYTQKEVEALLKQQREKCAGAFISAWIKQNRKFDQLLEAIRSTETPKYLYK